MAGFTCEKRTIGEREFTVEKLAVGKGGREGLTRILAIVGPAIAAASSAGGEAAGMALLAGAVQRFDDATLAWFEEKFGAKTTVDIGTGLRLDKEGSRDMVFNGDYLLYFEWLAFCLEVNYRDFFVGALAKVGITLNLPAAPTA